MDEASLDELREELARLEAAEAQISARRRFLHQQIDFGFASDSTREREREVSDERRELHRRIDALRDLLHVTPAAPRPDVSAVPADGDLPLDPR
jgi:chromosome segregation ATPase